jgi:elongation factor P
MIETADVIDVDAQYLYNDGHHWHFMVNENFEQHGMTTAEVGDTGLWLKEQSECMLTLFNGTPLAVTPPNFVSLKIVETDPGVRGDTSGGGGKPAKLETGATVRVPLFVQEGELIKVDTRTASYVSRAKE